MQIALLAHGPRSSAKLVAGLDDVCNRPRSQFILNVFFNPFTLKAQPEPNICYFHTFENNLRTKRKFTKYLKESCSLASDKHFSFICFSRKCFCRSYISKFVRPVLAGLSVNGLNTVA